MVQYLRLAQLMKNGPTAFQRIVHSVLGKYKGTSVWEFLDYGSTGSKDEEGSLPEEEKVLSCIAEAGLEQKIIKFLFGAGRCKLCVIKYRKKAYIHPKDTFNRLRLFSSQKIDITTMFL